MKIHGQRVSRLERRLSRRVADFADRFGLLESGDRIMVCVSGGKDSYALLDILTILQKRAPIELELVAVNLDQGWPGYRQDLVRDWLANEPIEVHLARRDHAAIIDEKLEGAVVPCSLCSRLRRGALYGLATDLRCNKVALGHHLDDAGDMLLLNLFFGGRLGSLPPKVTSQDGKHQVIRPLLSVPEKELADLAVDRAYPTVRCGCPFVCASYGERLRVRQLVDEIEKTHPRVRDSIRKALSNVRQDQLWMIED